MSKTHIPAKAAPRVWHKGPPPHVGWWNAGVATPSRFWRWWDGRQWSGPAMESDDAPHAAEWARHPAELQDLIVWSDYYPADARVPRLNPAEGWVLSKGERPATIAGAKRTEVVYVDGQRRMGDYRLPVFWRKDGNATDIYAWRPAA